MDLVITFQGTCPGACAPSLYSGANVSPPTPVSPSPSSLSFMLRVPRIQMCTGYLVGRVRRAKLLKLKLPQSSDISLLLAPGPPPAPLQK